MPLISWVNLMIKSAIRVISTLIIILTLSSSYAESKDIIMATSTTIYNSGILSYFIPLFEKRMPYRIKAIPASNEEAISMGREGKADLLFIKASDHSEEFISEGFGINKWNVMHNVSIIIGPEGDPARIRGSEPIEAFKMIARGGFPFVSCSKCPDIKRVEQDLWREAGIVPDAKWYITHANDTEDLIKIADSRSAYALSDRVEYLIIKEKIKLDILVDRNPLLFNQYIIIEVNPEKFSLVNNRGAKAFAEFVASDEGEDIIRRFGVDRYGEPLFYPR